MTAQQKRSRWRRLAWVGVISVAVAVLGWQVAKRAIDVDHYRSRIEAALADYTGLPVAIGALELAWHSAPCLSAHDVSIGEGDFHAVAARLDVFPRLAPLLHRQIEIARIELIEPAVTLPAGREPLATRWRTLREHIEQASRRDPTQAETAPDAPRLRIDALLAQSAALRFGPDDAQPIVSTIRASGIGGDVTEFSLDAEVPSTGARAEGTLRVAAAEGGEVEGELTVSGVQPGAYASLPEIAQTDWQAHAKLSGPRGGALALTLDASFEPIAPLALGGTIAGHGEIATDGVLRADLELRGEGLAAQGSVRLFAGDRARARIKSLHAEGDALAALLAAIRAEPIELRAAKDAAIDVNGFEVSLAAAPRVTKGTLRGHGLEVALRDAPLARDLRLDARAVEGAIRIAELRGGPFDLRGVVTPDTAAQRLALELTGSIAVDAALLQALGAPESVREANGVIALQELRADLPIGAQGALRYALRAQLAGGVLRLESDTVFESFSSLGLRLAGDDTALHFDASAVGATLGPISASAAYDPAARAVTGSLLLASAGADFLRDPTTRARMAPIVHAYSGAPIAFELRRDADPPHVQRIRLERAAAPRVTAALVLRDDPPDDPLRDLDVAADLPAAIVAGFLPPAARASGSGALRVRRSEGGAGFFAEADLGGLGIAVGDYLEKSQSEALRVRLEGEAGATWTARRVIVAAENAEIPFAIGESGVTAHNVDVDLAGFAFLLIDGARASGRLRLSLDSAAESVEVVLAGVALWLRPDLGVDDASGTIAVAKHDWGIKDLRVHGPDADAAFDIAVKEGALTGALRGARVDAELVLAILEQQQALDPSPDEPSSAPLVSGDLAVAVDQVDYRRASTQNFTAAVGFEQDDIHARDVAFEVGTGRVTGRVDIDLRKPEPPLVELDLVFTDLTRRFVDDLFADESLDAPGTYSGRLRYQAPLRDDLREMMRDASGTLTATGRNGTLIGRTGLATRLVTVLRSTEALRMRMPAFQDEGVVFDQVEAEFAIDQGVMQVRKFELDSTSYAISASGTVDFRDDSSKVPIEVNAIRGITSSLLERVPVAGDALKIVNVRLVATGSPWDMQVRIASITDQLLGVGLAGPKAVIKGVRDVMGLMRSAAGAVQSRPVPPAEPAPDPAPEPAPAVD